MEGFHSSQGSVQNRHFTSSKLAKHTFFLSCNCVVGLQHILRHLSIIKEITPEYSLGKTDAEAIAPILWPPDVKELTHWKKY